MAPSAGCCEKPELRKSYFFAMRRRKFRNLLRIVDGDHGVGE
jgi:hypothetical protein